MKRLGIGIAALGIVIWLSLYAQQKQSRKQPGETASKGYLLHNGWTVTPAGEQIPVGGLPLAMVLHPDGRNLLVLNCGYGEQSVDVIDTATKKIVSQAVVGKTWLGLGLSPSGDRVYAGGGMSNAILQFSLSDGRIQALPALPIGPEREDIYPGGICIAGGRLYAANNLRNDLTAVDLSTGKVIGTVPVGDHPYTCVTSGDGKTVYVSAWGAAQVTLVDAPSMQAKGRIATDDHPNAMVLSHDGKRLFVANANSNSVSVIDLASGKVTERISVTLYPQSPAGSTTNALALSPDGKTLYVANADNNDVAVVDVGEPGESRVRGFIPVGWYPTALSVGKDGRTLYVANGKGSRSYPNPKGPQPTKGRDSETQYIGMLIRGSVSIVPVPDAAVLDRHTKQVYANAPYTEKGRLAVPFTGESAIPRKVGEPCPIQHVIYVIKENRTFDQVLGDLKQGNGDPALTLFGEEVTPNEHALTREFVLLDNLYANAEVSAGGHNWSMGAYATDYVEKTWPSQYSERRKTYDYEGGSAIVAPSAGYIWDACKKAGVSYRSYGEWVVNGRRPTDPAKARPGALEGHIDPLYRGWDLQYSDLDRAKRFLAELSRFEKEGSMPRLQIVRLGNDHTMGTHAGSLTPSSYVAQNDLALGTLVEGISHSKFWPTTAIFVIEDDAQNGPDHVDAHRTIGFAISPFIRRGTVDSTMYSTASMLRTMELILGIPPMSQYDASAAPMFASFGTQADPSPYKARPARVSLTDVNSPSAPGSARSSRMNFEEADAAPDLELNEVIWQAVRGEGSTMPAPVRAAFVRPVE